MLEIDHSLRLSDNVVADMLKLSNLTLLSMAGNKIIFSEDISFLIKL